MKIYLLTWANRDLMSDLTADEAVEEVLHSGAVFSALGAAQRAAQEAVNEDFVDNNDEDDDVGQPPILHWIPEDFVGTTWKANDEDSETDYLIREIEVEEGS